MSPPRSPGATRELEEALGYQFRNPALLESALTHRSHSHELGHPDDNYERLEFLGDAFLGFVVAERLYREDDAATEGQLSRRRQLVVRTTTLAPAARQLGLGESARLGRGEQGSGGRTKQSLLADLFEAVLGAIYLDGGVRPARSFVRRHLGPALTAAGQLRAAGDDYKTRLQERIQALLRRTPRYRIVATSGPAHDLAFDVEVLLDDRVLGTGSGPSRKQAEQAAAAVALARVEAEEDSDAW